MIERLREALGGMGYELGGPELLDVLWLARAMGGAAVVPETAPSPTRTETGAAAEPPPVDGPLPATDPPEPAAPEPRTPGVSAPAEDGGRRHRLFGTTGANGAALSTPAGPPVRAVRAPGPRALPGLHGLARALRPLRRHRRHRFRRAVDVEATVRLTAESGVHDVVDRPEQELLHTAVLLVDDAASMRVWQPLVRDVRRLLERGGVFRAVHVHRVDLRGGRRAATPPRTESPITFLLTDGVDEAWRGAAGHRLLQAAQRSGPLVVLSPLPRRLWRGTAFDAQPQLLVSPRPFASDGEFRILDPLDAGQSGPAPGTVPVPVVGLSRTALGSWSRLLTRPSAPQLMDTVLVRAGSAADMPRAVPPGHDVPADQLLDRFRASFSPEAYRLAVRLSAIRPLSAPVIQLVRIATLPGSSSSVVAEVLLGELLRPLVDGRPAGLPVALGGGAGDVQYDFKPGIRDLLAGGLSTEQSIRTAEAVGRALEPHLGRMPDFAALLADPAGTTRLPAQTTPFAVLVSPVLDRLYGGAGAVSGQAVPVEGQGDAVDEAPDVPVEPVRFTAFGPQLAWRGGERFDLGTPQQRAVFAALLLRAGHSVTREELIDAVWGEDSTESATHTLRHHVSRLRDLLTSTGCVIDIDSQARSYRLRAEQTAGELPSDLRAAERLHAQGKAAQAAGDLAGARRLLAQALDQLDGEALDGLPGPYAEAQRARLEEWRLVLLEHRIELDLELDAHADLVPELTALAQAHPLRERVRGWLMVALYRMGRQAEALAVYADTRRLLADELAVDPSPELSDLHQRLLRADPGESLLAGRQVPRLPPPEQNDPPWPPTEGIHFRVLGPIRAERGTETLTTGSPQQRALLAALLLRAGRIVTAAELIDAVWGEDPPQQALAALRTYASRLRKSLGPETVLTEGGGYGVRVERGALDLHVVEDLAAASESARRDGDLPEARALLGRALDLWDGEPLAGLPGPYADHHRARLFEWQLQLTETQVDMDLELGEHTEVASQLTALVAAHPLRERLREQLMLALYRSGRQAEALAVYADTRRLLADELGVDPGASLSELQIRILRADESLGAALLPSPSTAPDGPSQPQQLPATVPDFTGRVAVIQELADHLTATVEHGGMRPPCVLMGMAGLGKTTLAVHVAHHVRQDFPDGQLYVDLQGAGPHAAEPESVLARFLRALGTPETAIPPALDERAALYRDLLGDRRVLVVLDNARDAAQVRPLLPVGSGCAVLITSRTRMVDLAGARLVDLHLMAPDEALTLFTKVVGEERVAPERAAALDVVAACGFLPLALRIAAARLAARRTWTVSVLAAKLADERRRLDELRAGDLAVGAAFELGYGQLEPEQARVFRLLSLADGPDISVTAAAVLADVHADAAADVLESLVDTSLLESAEPWRYRFNDLVRLYARACAERDEQPAAERDSALSRLLDFYLATAVDVYALERPGTRLVAHLEPTERPGPGFQDVRSAREWLHREAECVLACVRQSQGPALLRRAVDLLWIARDLAESGAFLRQYESTAEGLLVAAEARGDAHATGRAALILCETQLLLGRFDAAEERADQVLAAAQAAGDAQVVCQLAQLRGRVAAYQDRQDDATVHYEQALAAFRSDGDLPGEAGVLANLARVRLSLGDIQGALELAEAAADVFDGLGLSVRGANARYSLGLVYTAAGRHDEARNALIEARSVFKDARQRFWDGHTCFRLAQVELADGRPSDAAAYAEQALGILADMGAEGRRGQTLTLLGRALSTLGQVDRARACWQEALALFEQLGSTESDEVRGLLEASTAT